MNVFQAAIDAQKNGRKSALITVVGVGGSAPRKAGARMLLLADGTTVGTIGGGAVEYHAMSVAEKAIITSRPARLDLNLVLDLGMCCGGSMEIFIEPLIPVTPFVIFGAGHVAAALAPLLSSLEFAVTVVDDRPEFAVPASFPGCELRLEDPISCLDELTLSPAHQVLVVTHDY